MTDQSDATGGSPDAIHFYTRAGRPVSAYLSRRLQRFGFPLRYHDIWADPAAAAFVRSVARGNETVPTLVIGDVFLVAPSVSQVVAATTERAPHLLPDAAATPPASGRRGLFRRKSRQVRDSTR